MKLVKGFVAVAAVLLASTVSAGTLYWQVDEDESGDYITAQLYVSKADGVTDKTALSSELPTPTGVQMADVSSYTDETWRFFVELVNYDTGKTSTGYKWNYQDILDSGYVSFGATDTANVIAQAQSLGSFSQAPEPSSGLLLLMGGAILALRRRRQK